jgi:hypothetical protein
MKDAEKIAQELLDAAQDANEFIGVVTSINPNGTVNVKRKDGTSVNAIASNLNTGILAYAQKVNGQWYAFVANQRQEARNQTFLNRRSQDKGEDSTPVLFLSYAIAIQNDAGNFIRIEIWVIAITEEGKQVYKEKIHEENPSHLIASDAISKDYLETIVARVGNKHNIGILYSSGEMQGDHSIGQKVIYRHNKTTVEVPAAIEDNFIGNALAPRLVSSGYVGLSPGLYSGSYLRGVYENQADNDNFSTNIYYVKADQVTESDLPVETISENNVGYIPVRGSEFVFSSVSQLPTNILSYYNQIPPEIDPDTQNFYAYIDTTGTGGDGDIYVNTFDPDTGTRSWIYQEVSNSSNLPWRWRKFPSSFTQYQSNQLPKYSVNHELEIIPGLVVTNTITETITIEGEQYDEAISPFVPGRFGGYFHGIPGYTLLYSMLSYGL